MDDLPALQIVEFVLETFSSELAKGNLERHQRERVIQSYSHSDSCILETLDHVPLHIPNRPIQPKFTSTKNATMIQIIKKGQSPNLKHVTRTHRVNWIGCLGVNLITPSW